MGCAVLESLCPKGNDICSTGDPPVWSILRCILHLVCLCLLSIKAKHNWIQRWITLIPGSSTPSISTTHSSTPRLNEPHRINSGANPLLQDRTSHHAPFPGGIFPLESTDTLPTGTASCRLMLRALWKPPGTIFLAMYFILSVFPLSCSESYILEGEKRSVALTTNISSKSFVSASRAIFFFPKGLDFWKPDVDGSGFLCFPPSYFSPQGISHCRELVLIGTVKESG